MHVPNTPSKALGAALQGINISTTQLKFSPNQYQQTGTVLRSAFSNNRPAFSNNRPAHERLANVLNRALPIQPKNAKGIAQYNEQVLLWQSTYGQNGKGPNEIRLYPLTPGTVPVASGECWRCRHQTHHPQPCPAPPVPTLETKWRLIAQTIRKQVVEAVATPTVNINLVADESNVVHTYDGDELAYLQQLANQGKGEGHQCEAGSFVDDPKRGRKRGMGP